MFAQHETLILASKHQFNNESTNATYSVNFRLNTGGPAIIATDGEINWLDGTGGSGTNWTSDVINDYNASHVGWIRGGTIPESIPIADHDAIFDSQKWGWSGDGTMTITISSLTNGTYKVRIYTANESSGSSDGTFNINIQSSGNVSETPYINFGGLITGVYEFNDIIVSSSTMTIQFSSPSPYYFLNAIELLKQD